VLQRISIKSAKFIAQDNEANVEVVGILTTPSNFDYFDHKLGFGWRSFDSIEVWHMSDDITTR